MRTRGWVATAGVIAAWAGVVLWSAIPATPSAYLQHAVRAAQDALSASGTALLVGEADLEDRLLSPYTATAVSAAQEKAATAVQEVLTAPVSDASSENVRSELVPILLAASDGITEIEAATADADPEALRAGLLALEPVRDQLDEFVEANQ